DRQALRESPSSVTRNNDGGGALRELSADLFIQLVDVRSFAPSDDDESRIGNHSDLRTLGGRVDKSPLAFFGAQHHDHSKKGGFRRNLEFSTKSPSIQPRMELFEIRAFPQSETPTR